MDRTGAGAGAHHDLAERHARSRLAWLLTEPEDTHRTGLGRRHRRRRRRLTRAFSADAAYRGK